MPKAPAQNGWYDLAVAERSINQGGAVELSRARDRFKDVEPGISVREGMSRMNWELFRPGEHIPRLKNEVLSVADNIYRYNGLVKFVIDMMADFVVQGVQVHHRSPSKERRYRHWWEKVGGKRVSERIANLAYRHGAAIVKRGWAQLAPEDVRDLNRSVASEAPAFDPNGGVRYPGALPVRPNRIPMRYTFMNPMTVEVIGGELAVFGASTTTPVRYGMRIPNGIIKAIMNAKTDDEKMLVANLPNYLTQAQLGGPRLYPLESDKVEVLHYKKDDWQLWADPLVLSVLKDLLLYERMKDADRAALDGSISRIRLWKLGLPEHKIQPGPGAFRKLRDQLLAAQGGASMDLIWDASLNLQESSSDVYRFLGLAKYEPVLQAIFCGLGIPQTIGGDGKQQVLSLKTLIERLQYVRDLVDGFWKREFAYLQRAFGDRHPAELRYDMMTLTDDAAEQAIWQQLFDRDAMSLQTLQEKFNLPAAVEMRRISREYKLRDKGVLPYKTGPFTEAAPHPAGLAKAALQQGTMSPTEAGAPKRPKAAGDKSLLDRQEDMTKWEVKNAPAPAAPGGAGAKKKSKKGQQVPGPGRPKTSKDKAPRKKAGRQAAAAALELQSFARKAQARIAEVCTPLYLKEVERKNLRQLSVAQATELELRRFAMLCALPPGFVPDEATLASAWAEAATPPEVATAVYGKLARRELGDGNKPSAEESRDLQISTYVILNSESDDADADDAS